MFNTNTEKPKIKGYTKAFKVLKYTKNGWITPYQKVSILNNKLTAKGKPRFGFEYCDKNVLYGGAIHCFKTRLAAERWVRQHFGRRHQDIFEVIGKGFIAHNNEQIAFKSIKFIDDLEEYYIP